MSETSRELDAGLGGGFDMADGPVADSSGLEVDMERLDRAFRDCRKQAAGRLGLVREGHEPGGQLEAEHELGADESTVMRGATRLDPGPCQIERAIEGGQLRGIKHEPRPRRPSHLEPMAEEAEPGDVRRAADAIRNQDVGSGPIERPNLIYGALKIGVGGLALAMSADEQACSQRLRQDEEVARLRPALAQEPIRMRHADDRQAVLRLGVLDRVAAGKDSARLSDHGSGAIEN